MCGIAGFAGFPLGQQEAASRIRQMCDAIRHRGPDSDGYYVDDHVALGMRRLSIIDVAGGRQPISNENDSIHVVFNGEIYNHHELRKQLIAKGHRFRTQSDTEVLVHLYEEEGPDMAVHLKGMFAFAIWDVPHRKLFIARDRTGMKPLSYRATSQGISFCSELRSLWALDNSQLQIEPESVMKYLAFGYVPDPSTIFAGVKKLPPGHVLTWTASHGAQIRRYWNPPNPLAEDSNEDERIRSIRELLDHAVSSHLESEVPLGAFLSGGLDSSTVVALMARHASGRVRTFSIGFAEDKYDESAAARSVATELATDHTELIVQPNVEGIFESVACMFDEPFADSSAIPTFLVSQLARRSVTVSLSGDGGDELFGGYSRYREILGRKDHGHRFLSKWLASAGLMLPHFFPGRNRLIDIGRTTWGRYATTVVQPVRIDEGGVARTDYPGSNLYISEQLAEQIHRTSGMDFAAAMMQVDLETYLPGDILTKVDRTSMAVSLEARVPLLDFDLVDYALRIPGSARVTLQGSKMTFRKAIHGIVPESVLNRPKQGFEIPLGKWFRGPLRHRIEALREPSPVLGDYINKHATQRLVFEHTIGRRDHSAMLWRLIVLDCWMTAMQQGKLGQPPHIPSDIVH